MRMFDNLRHLLLFGLLLLVGVIRVWCSFGDRLRLLQRRSKMAKGASPLWIPRDISGQMNKGPLSLETSFLDLFQVWDDIRRSGACYH